MNTFNKLWGVVTPAEAQAKIEEQRAVLNGKTPENLEEQAISLVGTDIYEKLIKDYTEKQWGKPTTELPAFIIRRLPVRLTYDNNYFNDTYQGIPIGGYTQIVEKMLDHENIDVETNVDFFANKEQYMKDFPKIVFTGMIAPNETALYYKAANFFISASTSETQGLTYLESIASGTPIIAHGNPYLDNVVTDKMFGMLYYNEDDLAGAILEAVIATPDMEEKQLADKLYDISAENFGRRVYEFYLDLGISKDFQKDLKPDESRTKRFAKSMMYLPSKIITLPVDGSTRIMRASRRQIQRIRKYLE